MSDKPIFYYNTLSRGRIIHWMLEEMGIPYELHAMNWESGEHKSPEFLKLNPMGKVPVLVHKGVVITEAAAICLYLADAYPECCLAPAVNDTLRGIYYRWMLFAASSFEYARVDQRYPRVEAPSPRQLGYGTYEDTINTMEKAVSNGYLTGKFSAADIFVSMTIGWGLMQKDLEPRPAFLEYVKLCQNRDSFKRHMQASPMS